MTEVEVDQFRERMEEYLQRVATGDSVILVREGVPVAELHRTPSQERALCRRPVGLARGMGTIPPTFFEPLPSDLASLFGGEDLPPGTR